MNKTIIGAMCACLAVVSFNVSAALVSEDWKTAGDNLITRDTVTGLSWLDLTETANTTRDSTLYNLGEGQVYDGFRYATSAEVVGLWANFGIDLSAGVPRRLPGYDPGVTDAISYLGNTTCLDACNIFPEGALGLTADQHPTDSNKYEYIGAYHNANNGTVTTYDSSELLYRDTDYSSLNFGHYLVSPVPVPAAVWLFGSGLIGLIGLARRKA